MDAAAMIVLTTCASAEDAEALANRLVSSRQAACVNCLDHVRSIYRWQGAVESGAEVLLLIKTTEARLAAVRETIHAHGGYELPEFLVVRVETGTAEYLRWLADAVSE